jgi:hypothetical protein
MGTMVFAIYGLKPIEIGGRDSAGPMGKRSNGNAKPFKHMGVTYPSRHAFCTKHGITDMTLRYRISKGITDERLTYRRLLRPPERRAV